MTRSPLITRSSALFMARMLVSMFVAMAIAFRFDLSSPGGAAITVSIIALPEAGMVLEKSFYRLLGTLLGGVMTLILVGVLAQHEFLFLTAVAVWIALCTAASAWFRAFRAYAWLLCGYTTCLIGFPAFLDADHAFDIAVDRLTIVAVGIVTAGVVNLVFAPIRSAARLDELVDRLLADLPPLVDAVGEDVHRHQAKLAVDLGVLEEARLSGEFENPENRLRAPRVMLFAEAMMNAFSQLGLLHRLTNAPSTRLSEALEPLRAKNDRAATLSNLVVLEGSITQDHSAAALVLQDTVIALRRVLEAYERIWTLDAPVELQPYPRALMSADGAFAALMGARAAVALGGAILFWIGSRWPDGMLSCVFATVLCSLLASHPTPRAAVWQMCKGAFISAPAAVLCYSLVLPQAHDFATFVLALTPFLGLGAWLMTRPGGALQGSGYLLIFLMSMNLTAVMRYDIAGILNALVASLAGFLMALVAIVVIGPADRDWRARRLRAALLESLKVARFGQRAQFEHRVRDFTAQLVAHHGPEVRVADEELAATVLSIGTSVIRLRQLVDLESPSNNMLARALDRSLAAAMKQRPQVLAELVEARQTLLPGKPLAAALALEAAFAGLGGAHAA